MARPPEKLAASLEILKRLQDKGIIAIRSADLPRVHRERLLKNGFLQDVMKGWYIPARPDEPAGESTAWYASFWSFCAAYLDTRFSDAWCLSPEQSLSLHAGNHTVPRQLLVRASKARNKPTPLPFDTSLLEVRAALPTATNVVKIGGLRLFSLPAALVASGPAFFENQPIDARTALTLVRDGSEVLTLLLEGGHSVIAGRLAGSFRNIGRTRIADDILKTMRAAGYTVRERDPFVRQIPLILPQCEISPFAGRIRLMWQQMREPVLEMIPPPPAHPNDMDVYLRQVEDVYVTDAYHSLSIEGYRVSPELIDRVRRGNWDPDANEHDREHRNALVARGYWQAFQAVKDSLRKVLDGNNPGRVADHDHGDWYREMFAPSVTAGLLRPADLAGYRNGPVFVRRSMHLPPSPDSVRDAMPVFFEMLTNEIETAARVVLGHFIFVYIHPYTDGNGRMGRFLMNVMLAASGYPWTVVPLGQRDAYMAALEYASAGQDILPFASFLGKLIDDGLQGRRVAELPSE